MPKPAAEAVPNELLMYERTKRHWTQNDVVEEIFKLDKVPGLDVNTIGRWERGITEPDTHHLRLLTTLYKRSVEELGYVSEDRIPFTNIDGFSLRNPFFIGREDFLKKLHVIPSLRDEYRKKYPRKYPLLQHPQALIGLGGIGKTQIALEYAYRYIHDYHTIVWLRADSIQTLRLNFAAIATLLNLPEKQQPDQEQSIAAVKRWLKNMTRWLLIFDNVDNPEDIYTFFPSPCYGHILITTRSQFFVPEIGIQSVDVDEMTSEEAVDFLMQRAKLIDRATSHTSALPSDRTLAHKIAETLGRLPLAIDQAGAYIQRTQCGLSRYYAAYQKEHEKLLDYRGTKIAYSRSVASTWSLNFEKIREANPVAIDLLYLFAFLHPDAIPEAMLLESASNFRTALAAVAENLTSLDHATEELLKYSLVRRNSDASTYTIHRLVQTVVKDQMPREMQRQWAQLAVQAVNQVFPDVKFTTWPRCERYLSHAQTCVEHIAQWSIESVEAARLLDQLGIYFLQHGQYSDAGELFQQGLKIREHLFGSHHLDVALSLTHLGLLHYYHYQDKEAELFYLRALQINEQLLGPTHPALNTILHHLGNLYYNQDNYTQAEPYYQRAKTILEQLPEAEPNDLAANLSSLGLNYYKQKKYAEAEPLLRLALEIDTKTLGTEHPDVATQLTNLARLNHDRGTYTEAESLFKQALTIREQALGPSALAVANSLHYLAKHYQDRGAYTEAEPLLKRAATIVRQELAPTHPFRRELVKDYSHLLQEMGQVVKARRLLSEEK